MPDFRPATKFNHSCPPSSPRHDSPPRRYRARARKLTPDQESAIRANADNRSLRELAAQFGVSHETIRSVLDRAKDMLAGLEQARPNKFTVAPVRE